MPCRCLALRAATRTRNLHGRGTQWGCFPALQAGYVNFAYMKAGPLAKRPPRGLRPLIVVLGFTQTLNSAPTQVLRYLAQNRTVRAKALLPMLC